MKVGVFLLGNFRKASKTRRLAQYRVFDFRHANLHNYRVARHRTSSGHQKDALWKIEFACQEFRGVHLGRPSKIGGVGADVLVALKREFIHRVHFLWIIQIGYFHQFASLFGYYSIRVFHVLTWFKIIAQILENQPLDSVCHF